MAENFGKNKFHFCNKNGEVSEEYLRAYIRTWCRVERGFTYNREANLAYFDSDEFKSQHVGLSASELGHAAALSPRWNRPAGAPRPVAGGRIEKTESAAGSVVNTNGVLSVNGFGATVTGGLDEEVDPYESLVTFAIEATAAQKAAAPVVTTPVETATIAAPVEEKKERKPRKRTSWSH